VIQPQDQPQDQDQDAIYDLQSIVVHAGSYGSGHYYSYVRPDVRSSKWYRFDDHRVTEVDYYEDVIPDAFGGRMESPSTSTSTYTSLEDPPLTKGIWGRLFGRRNGRRRRRDGYGYGGKESCAYMLQYVKRSDIPHLYH